ncbi:MAG: CPBP family intramembrane metalloprotease [Planctomycetota bacterium]|nr:MAG: CPBP family intramembrane metalloprotease [Planctomycetota bacterium]
MSIPPRLAQGLVLFAGGLALLPVAVLLVRRIFPGRNPFFLRYGFAKVVVGFALYAGVPALLSALLPEFALRAQLLSLAGGLAAFAFAAWICARMQPEGWRALGFHSGSHGRAVGAALLGLAFAAPAVLGAAESTRGLVEAAGGTVEPQRALVDLLALEGGALWVALALAIVVLPLCEELFFRGFLQPLCTQNFGDRGGIVVVSVLFMALHQPTSTWPAVFVLSMLLCGLMLRTQRILASWLAHALWNGAVLGVLLAWPQTREWLL